MSDTLGLLTFERLAEVIKGKAEGARAADKKAGWQRLRAVVRGLAGSVQDAEDVAVGGPWSLVRTGVRGYQGVSDAVFLQLDFDPTPGSPSYTVPRDEFHEVNLQR